MLLVLLAFQKFFDEVWLNPEFSKKVIRACMMGKKIFLKIYISCSLVPLSLSGIKKGLIPPKNIIVLNYFPTKLHTLRFSIKSRL